MVFAIPAWLPQSWIPSGAKKYMGQNLGQDPSKNINHEPYTDKLCHVRASLECEHGYVGILGSYNKGYYLGSMVIICPELLKERWGRVGVGWRGKGKACFDCEPGTL